MIRWYAAKTKPKQEAVAMENLARQNFESYAPKILMTRVRQKRISTQKELFFPGYVLVRFALADASWRAINSTRGVISLLTFGENGIPTPLANGVVEDLQQREIAGELKDSEVTVIQRGDRVRLKFGPRVDAIGKVIFTKGERLELLLNLLGRQTRVKAPLHAVEIVDVSRYRQTQRSVR